MSRPRSNAGALCVMAPTAMRSTPVWAIGTTVSSVTPPLASSLMLLIMQCKLGTQSHRIDIFYILKLWGRTSVHPSLFLTLLSYSPARFGELWRLLRMLQRVVLLCFLVTSCCSLGQVLCTIREINELEVFFLSFYGSNGCAWFSLPWYVVLCRQS